MPLNIYKNKNNNNGYLCSFSFFSKKQTLFLKIKRQTSNNINKHFCFEGGEEFDFEFELPEIGQLIHSIDKEKEALISYEDKNNHVYTIIFSPYRKDGIKLGYILKIERIIDNTILNINIGFFDKEVAIIREYLSFVLEHCFSAIYALDKKIAKELKNEKTKDLESDF